MVITKSRTMLGRFVALFVNMLAASTLLLQIFVVPSAQAQALCSPSYMLVVNGINVTSTAINIPVNGIVPLSLNLTATGLPAIQSVTFMLDGTKIIGRVTPASGGTGPIWSMNWATMVLPTAATSTHTVSAVVLDTANNSCMSITAGVTIPAQPQSPITATIAPVNANLLTNYSLDFGVPLSSVRVATTVDISAVALYSWQTTIGSITPGPSANIGHFSSGPVAGSGVVSAVISYGGTTLKLNSNVLVSSPISPPSGTQTTTTTTNNTTNTTTPPSGSGTIAPPAIPTTLLPNSDNPTLRPADITANKQVQACTKLTITDARLAAIDSGQVRPTQQEFEQLKLCFNKSSFVVASTLSPVEPTKIKDIPQDTALVSMSNPTNTTVKKDSIDYKQLVFKGKAKPNSTVLLYVFSEPLVLATTSGSDGTWSYTLEDPLEPGSHEAYAMVSNSSGNYQRSNPLGFLIGKVSASPANPNGYSLELGKAPASTAKQNNRSTNFFMFGVIGVIAMAAAVVAAYLSMKNRKLATSATLVLDGAESGGKVAEAPVHQIAVAMPQDTQKEVAMPQSKPEPEPAPDPPTEQPAVPEHKAQSEHMSYSEHEKPVDYSAPKEEIQKGPLGGTLFEPTEQRDPIMADQNETPPAEPEPAVDEPVTDDPPKDEPTIIGHPVADEPAEEPAEEQVEEPKEEPEAPEEEQTEPSEESNTEEHENVDNNDDENKDQDENSDSEVNTPEDSETTEEPEQPEQHEDEEAVEQVKDQEPELDEDALKSLEALSAQLTQESNEDTTEPKTGA